MHHFMVEIRQQELGSVGAFSRRAQDLYEENLAAYVTLVMRRSFAKIIVRLFLTAMAPVSDIV